MAEGTVGEIPKWTTTVILSSSLQGHEVSASLKREYHKVRFSHSVDSGCIIFPLSGVAFLLANTQEILSTSKEIFFDWIEKFIAVHRNCFLVIVDAKPGPREWQFLFAIQQRFLGSNLRIIPVHNNSEIVKTILVIAKVTCKPHLENISGKLLKAKTQINACSPVWHVLGIN